MVSEDQEQRQVGMGSGPLFSLKERLRSLWTCSLFYDELDQVWGQNEDTGPAISVICAYRISFSCDSRWYEHKWNLTEPKPGLSKSVFCIPHMVSLYPLGLTLVFYKVFLMKQPASDRFRGAKFWAFS